MRINLEQLKIREAVLVSPEQLIIPLDIEDFLKRFQGTARDEHRGDEYKGTRLPDKEGIRGSPAQPSESVNPEELHSPERSDNRPPTEEEIF
ncbi:MAG: hypothetical protein JSV46_00420, partial [Candidatus Aminicenantes bacterium]